MVPSVHGSRYAWRHWTEGCGGSIQEEKADKGGLRGKRPRVSCVCVSSCAVDAQKLLPWKKLLPLYSVSLCACPHLCCWCSPLCSPVFPCVPLGAQKLLPRKKRRKLEAAREAEEERKFGVGPEQVRRHDCAGSGLQHSTYSSYGMYCVIMLGT